MCQTRPVLKMYELEILQSVSVHQTSPSSKIPSGFFFFFFILEGEKKQHEMIYRDSFSCLITARGTTAASLFCKFARILCQSVNFRAYVNKKTLSEQTPTF